VQPDIAQRFQTEDHRAATHVRLDIFPDGALARLHLLGYLSPEGAEAIALRWLNLIGEQHLISAMEKQGVGRESAVKLAAGRPFFDIQGIDATVRQAERGAVHARLGLDSGNGPSFVNQG
jgi:allantoicase